MGTNVKTAVFYSFFNHCIRFHPAASIDLWILSRNPQRRFSSFSAVDAASDCRESTISQAAPRSLDLRPFQHRLLGHLQSLSEFLVLEDFLGLLDEVTLSQDVSD